MEQKYYTSLEQIAMLEAELASRDDLQVELQRTKDELRDLTEELAVANTKIIALTNGAAGNKENRIPELARKSSRLSFHYQGIPENEAVSAKTSLTYTSAFAKPSMPRLSSSRSLRKIHGMLDQMKSLESRVANFKSSLPKPITPTKLSIPSSPSRSSSRAGARSDLTESPYTQITPSTSASSIPVARFRNSPSMSSITKVAAAQDAQQQLGRPPSRTDDHSFQSSIPRPQSPFRQTEDVPRRSRSAAGYHSPLKKNGHNDDMAPISGSPAITESTNEALSEGYGRNQKLSASYRGHPGRAASMSVTRLPKSQKSVDTLFNNLNISEDKERKTKEFDGKHSPFNYPPRKPSSSNLNGQEVPSRPGSAFGMLHSRQPIGHGRM